MSSKKYLLIDKNIINKGFTFDFNLYHEKINASVYPHSLTRYKIPLFASIIDVCDIYNDFTSKRSHQNSLSSFKVLKLMKVQMKEELDTKLLNKTTIIFR